ncbi:NUDIX domain-containing protein [Microbacterium invictum]|uniref:NUDIX domain-containing protein n=1 Tax=Microbacterium invictum TaxID=515415 RepID=A0ABZ0V8H8_9MICO|nr:NUDIX domain-containing protein [Microbacterium invictum]WQB69424.1 NUDIX domain-containing protein [Microbacterium invictum]
MTRSAEEPGAPSAADRLARVLADAAGESRPRAEDDGDDPGVPVAGTAVLLRDTASGVEALLLERPPRGSFAGAWVFPGGMVEPVDAAGGEPGDEQATARRAAVRETREEIGLDLTEETLVTLSRWEPPPGLPLRIRTWFFLAGALRTGDAEDLVLAAGEVERARWLRLVEALAAHGRGDLVLYPPTWVTLHGLVGAAGVREAIEHARMAGVRRFDTVARRGPDGPILLWAEDAEFAAPGPGDRRHRLEIGRLPWRYLRA